jgi:alanine-glyoxylate transaminase/(R)-3-amino-2-methylpropionate-pyruvate transaminase
LKEEDVSRIDRQLVSPLLRRYYRNPLTIRQGHMQWVWSEKGKRYLDLFGGVATTSVGHCHPKLVEATREQIGKLWHVSSLYRTEETLEYTEKLLRTLPPSFDSVFFCNSGKFDPSI